MSNPSWYSRFAKAAAHFCGRPRVFSVAVGIIAVWVVTGPLFGYSDTWQLVINTGTTIITSHIPHIEDGIILQFSKLIFRVIGM